MRIESLTFLRFFAAFIVVIFHYGKSTDLANFSKPFLTSGPQMVTFFFVLSGFVLTISYYSRDELSLKLFYLARVARIIPLYGIALGVMCYLNYGQGKNNFTALLLNILFVQSWFPPYPLSMNGPAWAVSVEAFFFITFPFILVAIKKNKLQPTFFIFIAFIVWFFTQAILSNLINSAFYVGFPSASHDLIFYFPLSHYCSFLLGIAGGYAFTQRRNIENNSGLIHSFLLFVIVLLVYFTLQNPRQLKNLIGFNVPTGTSFYAPMFLLLILSMASSKNIFTKILSLKCFVILGEASYALYILQKPVYTIYTKYISNHLNLSVSNNFYVFSLLLIFISILSLYFIEKPARLLIVRVSNQ
ncbi:MAG: acyltransferase [Desulfocapsaceae bacterium]|nr:acyltransferase [Desulfocapsaceae bacterium]